MAGARARGGVVFLAAVVVLAAASAEAAAVVVGLAKCVDCSRKNMKAAEAFKGLHVAIECKNSDGEYESKAAGEVDARTGAFSVAMAAAGADAADCFAQLHTAANAPCPGQEPSRIVPLSDGTFGIVAGKTTAHHDASAAPECASATLCGPIKKHLIDHFHKKLVPPKPEPKPKPQPDYHPVPPTPTYGHSSTPTPDYHPVPPTPTYGHPSTPTPDYHPVSPTPTYKHPSSPSATLCGPIKKHLMNHFHKKPVPPKSEPKPQPHPDYHPVPPTPTYGHPSTPTPIYHPPAQH